MNVDRVSPRQYQPTQQRKVTFNPVVQVKTFSSSDPIRPTLHASRLEAVVKSTPPAKKMRVEKKPEKPPPRPPYVTPETPAKAAGRVMAWCAIGSLLLIPAFGPGALVITGICAFVSAIYFIQHNRQIYQGKDHEDRTHFASSNRSISDQPRAAHIRTTPQTSSVNQQRQSAHTKDHIRADGAGRKSSGSHTAKPPRRRPA
jgi:hypothetical protein